MTSAELHPDAQSPPGHVMATEPHTLVSTTAVSLGTVITPRETQPQLVLRNTQQRRCSMMEILQSFQLQPSPTSCHSAAAKSHLRLKTLMDPLVSLSPPYLALQLEGEGELIVLLSSEFLLQLQQLLLQPQLLLLQVCHGGHHLLDHGEGPGCGQAGTFATAEPPSCSMSKEGAGQDTAPRWGAECQPRGVPRG